MDSYYNFRPNKLPKHFSDDDVFNLCEKMFLQKLVHLRHSPFYIYATRKSVMVTMLPAEFNDSAASKDNLVEFVKESFKTNKLHWACLVNEAWVLSRDFKDEAERDKVFAKSIANEPDSTEPLILTLYRKGFKTQTKLFHLKRDNNKVRLEAFEFVKRTMKSRFDQDIKGEESN